MEVVESYPIPGTKKQVHAFLGMVGYYRKFIPNVTMVSALLTDLTGKNKFNKTEKSLMPSTI